MGSADEASYGQRYMASKESCKTASSAGWLNGSIFCTVECAAHVVRI